MRPDGTKICRFMPLFLHYPKQQTPPFLIGFYSLSLFGRNYTSLSAEQAGFPLQCLFRHFAGIFATPEFPLQSPSERFIRAGGAARAASVSYSHKVQLRGKGDYTR